MKHLLLLLCTIALFSSISAIQAIGNDDDEYDIKIIVNGLGEDRGILAYYYMDKKYIKDTIDFDANGVGYLQGDLELNTGVYLLAFPSLDLSYFELLLGEDEKKFTLETDAGDFIENFKSKGSVENKIFYENMRFLMAQGKVADELKKQAVDLDEESDDYIAIHNKLIEMDRAVKARRKKMIADHPDAFYTTIVKAMSEIGVT